MSIEGRGEDMASSSDNIDAKDIRSLATDLQALADFLPVFRQPGFQAGTWAGGAETEPGVIQMPYVSYDPVVDSFRKVAYEHGWVKKDFAWSAWMQSDEARSLRAGTAIRSATSDQLGQLLTFCIRQDRFVEGALMGAFESGLILRIVERAAVLAAAA